jgi:hypothetical protein
MRDFPRREHRISRREKKALLDDLDGGFTFEGVEPLRLPRIQVAGRAAVGAAGMFDDQDPLPAVAPRKLAIDGAGSKRKVLIEVIGPVSVIRSPREFTRRANLLCQNPLGPPTCSMGRFAGWGA